MADSSDIPVTSIDEALYLIKADIQQGNLTPDEALVVWGRGFNIYLHGYNDALKRVNAETVENKS